MGYIFHFGNIVQGIWQLVYLDSEISSHQAWKVEDVGD